MRSNPIGASALMIAAMSWALGSAWSRHLSMPTGMMASAVQMMIGGLLLLILSLLTGERMTEFPTQRAVWAFIYLLVFGSFIGYSSYTYLINRVRPALATSYAYVNPVIAVLLGVLFLGESITGTGIFAMGIIVSAVALVIIGQKSYEEGTSSKVVRQAHHER